MFRSILIRPAARRMKLLAVHALAVLGLSLTVGSIRPDAIAHEGHEHGDAPAAVVTTVQPRVSAQSETYELLAVLEGERLSINLDRFATNEPVSDAAIAVTVGDGDPMAAVPAGNGVYTIASPRFAGVSEVELVFAITANSGDDLLVGTLTLPEKPSSSTATAPRAEHPWRAWQARIPARAKEPMVLAGLMFALGVLFGLLLRGGRTVPALGTAAATIGVL